MRSIGRAAALAAALLLLVGLLSGCGAGKAPAEEEPEVTAEEPAPTLSPEEEAAAAERAERLEKQEDGFLLDKGYLYAVDAEGNLRTDCWLGVLYFDGEGRYSSGSKDLDRLVAAVIRKHTDDSMSRMDKLRAMYDYTTSKGRPENDLNIKYVGFANHENSYKPAHGEDGWMVECAVYALENKTGNCYHFAATFAALARGLGFQAYAASGVMGSDEQEHGWVEIVDANGSIWYSDPETEYSRRIWMKQEYDLFYKSRQDIGGETGLGYLKMVDPFEAERKEAEEQGRPAPSPEPRTQTAEGAPAAEQTGTDLPAGSEEQN